MRTENAWKAALKVKLESQGAKVLSLHGHGMQAPGWPDLFVASTLWRGWLELKAITGELSAAQRIVIRGLVKVWPGSAMVLRGNIGFTTCSIEDHDGVTLNPNINWRDSRTLLECLAFHGGT